MICLIVAGKLFHTRAVLRQQNFCRREWYACVEQRVFCRKMSVDDDDHGQRRVECRSRTNSRDKCWCKQSLLHSNIEIIIIIYYLSFTPRIGSYIEYYTDKIFNNSLLQVLSRYIYLCLHLCAHAYSTLISLIHTSLSSRRVEQCELRTKQLLSSILDI